MIDNLPPLNRKLTCGELYKAMTVITFKQFWMSGLWFVIAIMALVIIIIFVAIYTPLATVKPGLLTYTDLDSLFDGHKMTLQYNTYYVSHTTQRENDIA